MNTPTQQARHSRLRFPLLLGLLLLIALAASACSFEVQPIEEYTSEDGYLSLTHPAAWDVLDEDASDGTTTALLGTHADLISMDTIPPGEAGVGIMVMPNFFLEPGGDAQTLSAEELASLIRESGRQEQSDVGEIEAITLENGTQVFRFKAPSAQADMTVHTFSPAEGILAAVAFISAAGDDNAALMSESEAILNSIQFNGDPAEFTERAREIMGIGN